MWHRVTWQVNQERHSELLKVAEAQRLAKENKAEGFSRKNRLFINVGDFLVSTGLKVKARYEPAMQQ